MALSLGLEKAGFKPQSVETEAACTIEKVGEGFKITTMRLRTRATVPDIDDAKFQAIAAATKESARGNRPRSIGRGSVGLSPRGVVFISTRQLEGSASATPRERSIARTHILPARIPRTDCNRYPMLRRGDRRRPRPSAGALDEPRLLPHLELV